jgi:hypothetical protein
MDNNISSINEIFIDIAKEINETNFEDENIHKYNDFKHLFTENETRQYALFRETIDFSQNKNGKIDKYDILVGFYCKHDGILTLKIGDNNITSTKVKAGQFIYALDDESIIPLIHIQYFNIYIEFSHNVDIIYGIIINNNNRRLFYNSSWTHRLKQKDCLFYYGSMACPINYDNISKYDELQKTMKEGICFPNMYSLLSYREKRSAEEELSNENNKRKINNYY